MTFLGRDLLSVLLILPIISGFRAIRCIHGRLYRNALLKTTPVKSGLNRVKIIMPVDAAAF